MMGKYSEVCPICGEVLWVEWGFMSESEMYFQQWINHAYNFHVDVEVEMVVEIEEIEE